MEWTTLPAPNPPRKKKPVRVSSTARELDFVSVAVSHPPENIPVLLSRKRMVRFSCAVMETGSDGWLTTRLISSLPAERKMGKKNKLNSNLPAGDFNCRIFQLVGLPPRTYRPWSASPAPWRSAPCSGHRAASRRRRMTPPPGRGRWPRKPLRWACRALEGRRGERSW